jgi:hypothetical protein
MPISIQPPQPGDLITSSFVKQLIDQLQMLDSRVSYLESVTPGSGGQLSVSFMEPVDLQLGDTLRIHGLNFGLPAENTVTFDGGTPFSQFQAGSSDRLLILTIPNLVFSGDSHLFTVAVTSSRGSDSRQIMVRQAPVTRVQGTVLPQIVLPTGVTISPPAAVFRVSLAADTNLDEVYDLTPSTVTGAGWSATMVTDASGGTALPPLAGGPTPPPWQVRIPKGGTVDVFVKLAIPVSTGTSFVKLLVASVTNPQGVTGSARSPDFQIGQAAPPTPTLAFGFTSISGPGARVIAPDSFGFTIPTATNQINRINFQVKNLKPNASYTMGLAWNNNASNGWTASTQGSPWTPTSPPTWPVPTATITTGAAGGTVPTSINLASLAGASQAQLKITVTNSDPNLRDDFGIYMPFVGP